MSTAPLSPQARQHARQLGHAGDPVEHAGRHRHSDASRRPSIGSLLESVRDDASQLLRDEVELFKVEMRDSARFAAKQVAKIAVGGAVALAGGLLLLFGVATGLAVVLAVVGVGPMHAAWIAPVVLGALVALAGVVVAKKAAKDLQEADLEPRQTMETLKDDKEWMAARFRSQ